MIQYVGGMMQRNRKRNITGLVYSTEQGKMCPSCGKVVAGCVCKQKTKVPAGDGIVRLMRQTKGRKGKGVVVITGLDLDVKKLKILAKSLKQKCGCGGSVKAGVIEMQGDQRDILEKELCRLGYTVKRAGG